MQGEDNMLVFQYKSPGGGSPPVATRGHLRSTNDAVFLAHLPSENPDAYFFNTTVTITNVYNNGGDDRGSPETPVMNDHLYEGAVTAIPTQTLTFMVNRYNR